MITAVQPAQVTSPGKPQPSPMETLQQSVSASRLNCWLQCRLKFFFRYVQRITKSPTPALHVGSVVHLVLQNWNMARWKKQAFELQRFKSQFETAWINQPAKIDWDGEETGQKNTAWSLLQVTLLKPQSKPTRCRKPWRCQSTLTSQNTD